MTEIPVIDVNQVGVHLSGEDFIVMVGSKTEKIKLRISPDQFMLLILEYAKARGLDITVYTDGDEPKAKPFTPWTVKGGKQS